MIMKEMDKNSNWLSSDYC